LDDLRGGNDSASGHSIIPQEAIKSVEMALSRGWRDQWTG
jgi:hypothetical protein